MYKIDKMYVLIFIEFLYLCIQYEQWKFYTKHTHNINKIAVYVNNFIEKYCHFIGHEVQSLELI